MKTFQVLIQGLTPILQHRFSDDAQVNSGRATRAVNIKNETPREQAEKVSYRTNEGFLYHPGAAIMRLLRDAGSAHKQRGSRKSCKYIVPAAVRVAQDQVPLLAMDGETPLKDFEVDSRAVVIPSTKGRIMRHRPRCDEWMARFDLVINEDVLGVDTIRQFLDEGGQRIGIGDFRPEKGGPFGVFQVNLWEELEVPLSEKDKPPKPAVAKTSKKKKAPKASNPKAA
ncbi:MAG: hypothetical protein HRT46_11575 [Deltaproteobacteria bacterium]|nr:hypothetical protein [Deltaproteobacteria bacterium]